MVADEQPDAPGFANLGLLGDPRRISDRDRGFDAESTSLLVRSVFAYIPNVVGAILVLLVGSIIASFLARSVLIGAVNLNMQYARLLSLGLKWLVTVLAVEMALGH